MNDLLNIARGFLMGAADLVPGVSGGTVALVLGIYRRLVSNIKLGAQLLLAIVRLDRGSVRQRFTDIDWRFLLTLLAGIVLAIVTLASVIQFLRTNHPVETAAVFFGLVAASIVVAWRLIGQRDTSRMLALAAVAVAAFIGLGLRSGPVEDPVLWMFFASGAVAICAMILPGISGAFILLMLGMYGATIEAVHDRSMGIVVVFVLGAIVGLSLFAPLLDSLLGRHHDMVMAVLVGLMAGSLRVLWPWPDGTETTTLSRPTGAWPLTVLLAVAAGAIVLVGAEVARRRSVSLEPARVSNP